MILRWWFRLAFWVRRGYRRPVESLTPWVGDSRAVERRLLVARAALRVAEDLRVYPPDIAAEVLQHAGVLVISPPGWEAGPAPLPEAERPERQAMMRVWWGLVMLGVTLALLAVVTGARAELRRVDLYDRAGQRVGWADVSPGRGRVDLYDPRGRRVGQGQCGPAACAWTGADGRRLAPVLPDVYRRSGGAR